MDARYHVAILGFDEIGQMLHRALITHPLLSAQIEVSLIVALAPVPDTVSTAGSSLSYHPQDLFDLEDLDLLIDTTRSLEPTYSTIKNCLNRSITVVSANPLVTNHAYHELTTLAVRRRCFFLYEGAVAFGSSLVAHLHHLSNIDTLTQLVMRINPATHELLHAMQHNHRSYIDAYQQLNGDDHIDEYEGYDSQRKLLILSRLAFDMEGHETRLVRFPLGTPTPTLFETLHQHGYTVIYGARMEILENGMCAAVLPLALPHSHPLCVESHTNAVLLTSRCAGTTVWTHSSESSLSAAVSGILSDLTLWTSRHAYRYDLELHDVHPLVDDTTLHRFVLEFNATRSFPTNWIDHEENGMVWTIPLEIHRLKEYEDEYTALVQLPDIL